MARVNLSPPWATLVSEFEELFKYDHEVHVVYNEEAYSLKLYVDSSTKAAALTSLLPEEYVFGNVKLTVIVVPANQETVKFSTNPTELFTYAFRDNPIFSFIKTITGIFANNLTYVVFKNRVVQFFNDDLGDIYGNRSTLYQEIAKNIFGEKEGVFFCTDIEEPATFAHAEETLETEWP